MFVIYLSERSFFMAQKNLIVYGKNGKRIGGGAAQLKQIKNYGGWDAYNREVFKAGYEYGWKGACSSFMKKMDRSSFEKQQFRLL